MNSERSDGEYQGSPLKVILNSDSDLSHEALFEALSKISLQSPDYKTIRENSNNSPFFFSNDLDMESVIAQLGRSSTELAGGLGVALLVGESYSPSLLPELKRHAQIVIFVDIDPAVLEHNQFVWKTLIESRDRDDFFRRYTDETKNPILKGQFSKNNLLVIDPQTGQSKKSTGSYTVEDLKTLYSSAEKRLGSKCFFHSPERFLLCQEAAKSLSCAFLNVDLFDNQAVKSVKSALDTMKATVTVMNASNLYYHDAERPFHLQESVWMPRQSLEKSMKILLGEPKNSVIIYSKYLQANALMSCAVARNTDEMISAYQKFIRAANLSRVMEKYKQTTDFNLTFRNAAFYGPVEELQAVVQFVEIAGMNLVHINACGQTKMMALHQAVRSQSLEKVQYLLTPQLFKNQTINLDGFSVKGTPLHIAWDKETRSLEIFEALLEAGANPHVADKNSTNSLARQIEESSDPDSALFLEAIKRFQEKP